MMDIETLKKIQETEKKLRIHNITISPQEAIDYAKNDVYIGGAKVPSFDDVSNQDKETKSLIKEAVDKTNNMDDKTSTELKKIIEEQGELISKQAKLIYELQGAVNDIVREIKKMQSTVPTKDPGERQQVLKAEDKKEHPRSGNYTSDDVSVEKFFYAGSK